ncbi:membrane protein [Hyphomicrobium sp. 99]|uniref:COG4705 family protein n=1 Tax=Hyphomicrobium sp. 99 TaxID=1163419 RepID=UPI0005F854A4|nr:membrane protein [Hyphomicrobium sp. 99]
MNRDFGARSTPYSKVAEVTIFFWIMKILATTLGETAGDFISMTLGLGYYFGLTITFSILSVILWLQIAGKTYHPALFWTAIIATTTAGTEISDFMDRSLDLGYFAGSIILATGLALSLAVWYYRVGNLRVYPIATPSAEIMFWLAVLFSNSLGTAFGDYLVDDVGLTFIQGALVTAGIIIAVAALHYFTRLNNVILFWIAFVFTRPFGATFGDFLTKPTDAGGLSLPREYASLITLALLLTVLYVSLRWSGRKSSPRSE